MTLPNTIIGGTGRAGTTSLFRYLSAHPDVCGSRIKELMFFNTYKEESINHQNEYESNFSHCGKNHKIIIEATPHYLTWGKDVAHIIASILPHVKLIFILREPVERLYTIYRNDKNINGQLSAISFDDFVELAIRSDGKMNKSELETRFNYYLHTGCYAQQLIPYYNHFNADQIRVFFFDDFKINVYNFIDNVCEFLEIDSVFYRTFDFRIENKTRSFRNLGFHKLAYLINRNLEKYLNGMPRTRQRLRSLYLLINEQRKNNNNMSNCARDALNEYYRPHNQKLRQLLSKQSHFKNLPDWIDNSI